MSRRGWLLGALALAAAMPASAGQHVRVVLDTSGSMRTNDAPRLAILATLLLYDLADLERNLDDSFEVLTFDATAIWSDPASPPPLAVGRRVRARFGARDAFVAEISALPYDARNTYFYPGLRAALDDLERVSLRPDDARSLVLVTDGVPVPATRETELALIRRELLPRLQADAVRLYVLAFGSEATGHRAYLESLVRSEQGQILGRVLVDRDGSDLLSSMSEVFAQSFGYTRSQPVALTVAAGLDLEGGGKAERAAVVATCPAGATAPRLSISPPAGASLNAPGGIVQAATAGGSYSVLWVLSPAPGRYLVAADVATAQAAILRPSRVALVVAPLPPLTQTRQVMARTRLAWKVLVGPLGGAAGDPGPIDLSFRTFGPRLPHPEPGSSPYAWSSQKSAPPAGSGRSLPTGRAFSIEVEFPRDPAPGESSYRGYLEVEARRGGAVVGGLTGAQALAVDVFPRLAITPFPLAGDALPEGDRRRRPRALHRGDRACARFALAITDGRLPHPERPRLSVRAALDGSVRSFEPQLFQALFTLDGRSLAIAGAPAVAERGWSSGVELEQTALLAEHELCLQVGRPRQGDPGTALELPLRLTLLESPYDTAPVIEPFVLRAWIDRPTSMERRGAALGLALAALLGTAVLIALRFFQVLPRDLSYAVARDGETGLRAMAASPTEPTFTRPAGSDGRLPRGSAVRLSAPGERLALGEVRAARRAILRFRPAAWVRLEDVRGEPLPPAKRGWFALEVHRTYRLAANGRRFLLRLEYR